jgi:hypothetical protein
MSILTVRELEFLASLGTRWNRLYWNELAQLLQQHDGRRDIRHEAQSIARSPAREKYRPRLAFSRDDPARSTIEG